MHAVTEHVTSPSQQSNAAALEIKDLKAWYGE